MNKSFLYCLTFGLSALLLSAPFATAQTPIAHWRFDDAATDSGVSVATDVISSTASSWVAGDTDGFSWASDGRVGGALRLAGRSGGGISDDYFDVAPLGLTNTFSMSIAAWIRPEASQESGYTGVFVSRTFDDGEADGGAVNLEENYGIAWQSENGGALGHVDARISGAALDATTDISPDGVAWQHVALVWDSDESEKLLYIDGVLDASDGANIPGQIIGDGSWRIGQDFCCSGRDFRGSVDDLAVYDTPLTAGQISTIYTNGLNGIDVQGVAGPIILPGDVNGDGNVDLDDYTIINANMFSDGRIRNQGDLSGNNRVDYEDFAEWEINAPAAVLASVPEPSSSALLLMSCFAIFFGVRRSRR